MCVLGCIYRAMSLLSIYHFLAKTPQVEDFVFVCWEATEYYYHWL